MNKQTIRQIALKARNQLTQTKIEEKSQRILSLLETVKAFQEAQTVLFYYTHKNEVDTKESLEKWMSLKKIYLPQLNSNNEFEAILCTDLKELIPNRFGIMEPKGEVVKDLELILVPGVAFDNNGNRIGMGKGYYDRFLAKYKNILKIGLAFECQIFDELPKDPYDEPVDMIITEKRILSSLNS